MTRDYVRSSQPTKRKPATKAPVGRGKSSNTSAPFPVVRAVLALVLVIGFGIFLYNISGSSGETAQVAATQSPTEAPIPIEKQRPAKEEFDYMQILQNKEVPVELPDGQVIGDPSKDPQILQQQQKMQEMLRAQQERARLLVQQQNGQLPADQTTLIQPTTTLTTPAVRSVNTSKPATTAATNTIISGQPTAEPARTTDSRKPRSFAEVIANESNTARKPDSNVAKVNTSTTTAQPKTVTQERDEALAMFGKPRPYTADNAATTQNVTATTSTVSNKRYMMQCGAFRTADQASSLQSRIAVQGQSARISEGSNTSGTWHRVVLGPYASRPAAEQALSRLKGAGTVQSCTIYSK